MKRGRPQCKDIQDEPVLQFIDSFDGEWCFLSDNATSDRSVLHAMPDGVPIKLALAKMKMLIRRGLVEGCDCGCRGDFTLTKKGKAKLMEKMATQ